MREGVLLLPRKGTKKHKKERGFYHGGTEEEGGESSRLGEYAGAYAQSRFAVVLWREREIEQPPSPGGYGAPWKGAKLREE
jgi:hypothetical protein